MARSAAPYHSPTEGCDTALQLRLALNQQTAKLVWRRGRFACRLRLALNQQTAKLLPGLSRWYHQLRLALNQQTAKLAT